MAKFLIEGSYSSEGLKGLEKDKASGRRAAVLKAVEGVKGKLECYYFTLGEHDVMAVVELPDTVTAVALALHMSDTGLVRTKTTALLTVEETDEAVKTKVKYRGPGK